ncbi:MAG: histidine phosphatase family protein [Myxococcota bacterium]
MERTLYFVRHGETDWNAEGRIQGRNESESQLTARGEAQAEVNARTVAELGVDAIVASPLLRTRQTAAFVAAATGLQPAFDERLAEWDAGAWSGWLYTEVREKWPEGFAAWRADMWNVRSPDGENFVDLIDRGRPAIEAILARDDARVAIVSHGFIGRVLIGDLLGLEREEILRMRPANDTFYRLRRRDGAWRVDRFEQGKGPLDGLFA